MTRQTAVLCIVVGFGLVAMADANQAASDTPPLRLLLSEVQAGTMASEQYCTLVFADHSFHSEKAIRKLGKDRERKVYEGKLSDADWNALGGILESKELRELHVPEGVTPLVIEDAHTVTISVARDTKYQNLEFLDKKSRKPYDPQLKPLLGWWKTLRSGHVAESKAEPNPKCALDSTHPVFSQ